MLEYGLPPAPAGHRWFIRAGKHDQAKRYLHLEKDKGVDWRGRTKWESVREEYMVSIDMSKATMAESAREEAEQILKDIYVNFNLPTGEVR